MVYFPIRTVVYQMFMSDRPLAFCSVPISNPAVTLVVWGEGQFCAALVVGRVFGHNATSQRPGVGVSASHQREVGANTFGKVSGFQESKVGIEFIVAVVVVEETGAVMVDRLVKIVGVVRFGIAAEFTSTSKPNPHKSHPAPPYRAADRSVRVSIRPYGDRQLHIRAAFYRPGGP